MGQRRTSSCASGTARWHVCVPRTRRSREGDLEFLLADDGAGTLAYLRRSPTAAAVIALNLSDRERDARGPSGRTHPRWHRARRCARRRRCAVGAHGRTPRPCRWSRARSPCWSSGPTADLLAPDAPTCARGGRRSRAVELAWEPSEDASSYRVLRSHRLVAAATRPSASTATTFMRRRRCATACPITTSSSHSTSAATSRLARPRPQRSPS